MTSKGEYDTWWVWCIGLALGYPPLIGGVTATYWGQSLFYMRNVPYMRVSPIPFFTTVIAIVCWGALVFFPRTDVGLLAPSTIYMCGMIALTWVCG